MSEESQFSCGQSCVDVHTPRGLEIETETQSIKSSLIYII